MPRILNPGTLNTGPGKMAPDATTARPGLIGAGLVGPGPNIGEINKGALPGVPGASLLDSLAHHTDPRTADHEKLFADLFSSWVIRGGEMTTAPLGIDDILDFAEVTVLIAGVRTVLPAQSFQVDATLGVEGYVYIDGTDPYCPVYAYTNALPLPLANDVLVGEYTPDGFGIVLAYYDLRQPLVDVDKRLDITVGAYTGHDQPGDAHFNELADAVEFVARTTNVSNGQFRRIKIIGPTEEDITKLPMNFAISGLIIEGAGRRGDGSVGTSYEVSWRGDAPSLFNLNGCSDWVIRDVAFRFDDLAAPDLGFTTNRNLFVVDSGLASNIVFENLTLAGPAHSFLSHPGGIGATFGVSNLLFRNCTALDLTDTAIYVDSAVDTSDRVLIEHCNFTARKSTDAPGPGLGLMTPYGIIHAGQCIGWTVRDTILTGGSTGVFAEGLGPILIDNCTISDTDLQGVYLGCPYSSLQNSRLTSVYTLAAPKMAVTTTGTYVKILHNKITLSLGVYTDLAIDSQGIGAEILGNEVDYSIGVGDYSSVAFNRGMKGTYLFVNGDQVQTNSNFFESLVTTGQYGTYEGDQFLGNDPILVGSFNFFSNVTFGAVTVAFNGRVTLGSDCSFMGCHFLNGFQDSGVDAERNRFEGCQVGIQASIALAGNYNSFIGNQLTQSAAGMVLEVDGVGTIFCKNQVSVTTLHFTDGGGAGAQNFVVCDNVLQNDGADGGGIWFEGQYSTIRGNVVGGKEKESGAPNIYSINFLGGSSVCEDNILSFSLFGQGDYCLFSGNHVAGDAQLSTSSKCKFLDNQVQGTLTTSGCTPITIRGNDVVGAVAFEGGAGDFIYEITGNHFTGVVAWGLPSLCSQPVISNNHFDAATSFPGMDNGTFTGNFCLDTLSVQAVVRTTIQGNRCAGSVTMNISDQVVFQGNWVGTTVGGGSSVDLTGSDNYVVVGNLITGDLLVSAGAAATNTGVIVGNRTGSINSATHAAAPTVGQVAVGNKVDNLATVFNVAPGTATANSNNVED